MEALNYLFSKMQNTILPWRKKVSDKDMSRVVIFQPNAEKPAAIKLICPSSKYTYY